MAGFLGAAAWRRSRLFTGLAAVLLAFGPWSAAWLLGLPYMVLAGWLAVRGAKKAAGDPVAPRPPREPRARRSRQPVADAGDAPARPAPPASKRYTPPQQRT